MFRLVAVFCVLNVVCYQSHAASWSYDDALGNGPSTWSTYYPSCGGSAQSPININSASSTFSASNFVFTNYNRVQTTAFTLTNSGHSIQVNVNVKDITLSGGGLKGTYVLEQFHMHWGKDSTVGSEHQVDTGSYPLEIHLVHYNNQYADVASAAAASGDTQAIAVLGVFVSVSGGTPSETLGSIADNSVLVSYKGNQTSLNAFAVDSILPLAKRSFYRYSGSLTTPGCNEVVIWTVFSDPIYTTEEKLEKFRQLHENAAGETDVLLDFNYRPTQLLNGRSVKKSV